MCFLLDSNDCCLGHYIGLFTFFDKYVEHISAPTVLLTVSKLDRFFRVSEGGLVQGRWCQNDGLKILIRDALWRLLLFLLPVPKDPLSLHHATCRGLVQPGGVVSIARFDLHWSQ